MIKRSKFKKLLSLSLCTMLVVPTLFGCSNTNNKEEKPATSDNTIELKIMATSDMHDYLMNYDYYTTEESNNYGLIKLATIVKEYRKQFGIKDNEDIDNMLLVDNGDLIQGNPLGDYFAKVEPVKPGEKHPVYKALDSMKYDVAALGNHEFNYGLDFIKQITKDATTPYVNANIYNAQSKENEFTPYIIIKEKVIDKSGTEHEVKVGFIGLCPPQILSWDSLNLEGKITVEDMKATAEKFVPKIKDEGADVVVALIHSGYGANDYIENVENQAAQLTLIKGIDAVVSGHTHELFPAESYMKSHPEAANIDIATGKINGIPTIQPAKYAEAIGVITLNLQPEENTYKVVDSKGEIILAKDKANDEELVSILKDDHEKVIKYVNSPVGETTEDINSFFSLVADTTAVQLISEAQLSYAIERVANEPSLKDYQGLPILSAAAPFKAGLTKGGVNAGDFIDIPKGQLSIKDLSSLYKFPNTLTIMKVTGKEVRQWLEMSSGMFNTIDPNKTEQQSLLNENFPSFNFDTLDGVKYEIDVTKPARYDNDGNVINNDSNRITNLTYNDKEIADTDEFLVVTNNYRAGGGGNFPIFGEKSSVVYISIDEVRTILSKYIESAKTITPKTDNNWRLMPIPVKSEVVFISNEKGMNYLDKYPFIKSGDSAGEMLTQYKYDLNAK